MGFEQRELDEKTYKDYVERLEDILEADVSLMPDTSYHANDSYLLQGLGEVFDGVYRIRRVEHLISPDGYEVNTSMRMTFDHKGTPSKDIERGKDNSPKKAGVTTKDELVYTVKSGDNLWNICKAYCGNGSLFKTIAKINGLNDPSEIYPGDKLKIPGKYRK